MISTIPDILGPGTLASALPLAAKDFSGLVFVLVVAAVAAILQGINALNKKVEEERRRLARETIEREAAKRAGLPPQLPIPSSIERILTVPPQSSRAPQRLDPVAERTRQRRIAKEQQKLRQQEKQQQQAEAKRARQRGSPPPRQTVARAPSAPPPPPVPAAASAYAHRAGHRDIASGEIVSEKETSASGGHAPHMAGALHQWLRPTTLRQQFILTELFQPPLALREERR